MSLEYRVLWIDDTPDWVESVKGEIEEEMKRLSLLPIITVEQNGINMMESIKNEGFDLLIVDYHLPEKNGDNLIKEVRDEGELTEIVFYSQDERHQEALSDWEGVHYSLRNEAEEIIKEVAGWFAKKNKNISVMRGVIIAEAIDVENKLTEIIKKLFDNKAELFQSKILNKPYLDFEKKREFVQSCLKDKIKEERNKTPNDSDLISKLGDLNGSLNEIKKEIIEQRNILAHSEKTTNPQGFLVLNDLNNHSRKIIFDNEWKNTIRTNIRKHRKNLQMLYDIF